MINGIFDGLFEYLVQWSSPSEREKEEKKQQENKKKQNENIEERSRKVGGMFNPSAFSQ